MVTVLLVKRFRNTGLVSVEDRDRMPTRNQTLRPGVR